MKKICSNNTNYGISILMAAFLFIRTALLCPLYCFAMNDRYPYFDVSVEGIVFAALLLVFCGLSVRVFLKICDRISQIAGLIYFLALSDPLFFSLQDTCLKLAINILILLFILNAISEKAKLPSDILMLIVLFVSTLLVPYTMFAYAPIILSVFILVNRTEIKNNRYIKIAIMGVVCTVAGFLLNKLLCEKVTLFGDFIAKFSFADVSETNKHWKLIFAFLPAVVFFGVFYNYYIKVIKTTKAPKGKKSEKLDVIADVFFIPFIISFITVFFIAAEGAYASNIFIMAMIVALLFKGDKHCVGAIDNIMEFVKKHKFISAIILVAVYAIALIGTINYHSSTQLVFFVRY